MKTMHTLLVVFLTLTSTLLLAQNYTPVEQTIPMGSKSVNAWVINVGEEPTDVLRKSFMKYAKQQWDVKMKKDGKEAAIAKATVIPSLSTQQGDLKASFFTEGNETRMAVAFMPGYDISFNTQDNKTEMENLRKSVKHFVKSYKMAQYQDQLTDNERRKKSLESAFEKNEREQKRLARSLTKIEKQLASDKTKEAKRFELNNKQIGDQSRQEALDLIMHNQRDEIAKVEQQIQSSREAISQLETLFAEPITLSDTEENEQ